MAEVIYVLCALASVSCALLLVRSYARQPLRLTLLAGLCFAGLALNNVLLFVDLVVVPNMDLGPLRSTIAVASLLFLVVGLIVEDS
jgi:hypothetical protein